MSKFFSLGERFIISGQYYVCQKFLYNFSTHIYSRDSARANVFACQTTQYVRRFQTESGLKHTSVLAGTSQPSA